MRGEGYSLSDIAAATGNGNGGFGGDYGAWWIIIIIVLFGWGRGGYGFGGGNDGGYNSVPFYQSLDTDFATLERKIDGVYSGICDSTFALNNSIQNGFASAQNTMTQGFAGLNTELVRSSYENIVASNGINQNISNCCCDLKGIAKDNRYENLQNINALNNNMNNGFSNVQQAMCISTRDVIDNQNKNARDIIDLLQANKLEAKNERIQEQQNEINALRLAASQSAQNEYILNSLRTGCPVNAQILNPSTPVPIRYIDASCGCGCGCNC